jgi:hypothetical protein
MAYFRYCLEWLRKPRKYPVRIIHATVKIKSWYLWNTSNFIKTWVNSLTWGFIFSSCSAWYHNTWNLEMNVTTMFSIHNYFMIFGSLFERQHKLCCSHCGLITCSKRDMTEVVLFDETKSVIATKGRFRAGFKRVGHVHATLFVLWTASLNRITQWG